MGEKAQLSMRLDKNLLKDLKIIAIKKEKTMTEIVTQCLEEYIQENK